MENGLKSLYFKLPVSVYRAKPIGNEIEVSFRVEVAKRGVKDIVMNFNSVEACVEYFNKEYDNLKIQLLENHIKSLQVELDNLKNGK